jgi:hypothetical protein
VTRAALVALVVAGCTRYLTVATRNAPGDVELVVPPARETGYEAPADPGPQYLVLTATPQLGWGVTRDGAVVEPGLAIRVEHRASTDIFRGFSVIAGGGVVQLDEHRGTRSGTLFAEAAWRSYVGAVPLEIAGGSAVRAGGFDAGGQVTGRLFLMYARVRYLADGGVEGWWGFELPIPTVFGYSR